MYNVIKKPTLAKFVERLNSFEKIEDAFDELKEHGFSKCGNDFIRYTRKKTSGIIGMKTCEKISFENNHFNIIAEQIHHVNWENYFYYNNIEKDKMEIGFYFDGNKQTKIVNKNDIDKDSLFTMGDDMPGMIEVIAELDIESPEHFPGACLILSNIGFNKKKYDIDQNIAEFTKNVVMPIWKMPHPDTQEIIFAENIPIQYSIYLNKSTLKVISGIGKIVPDWLCHYYRDKDNNLKILRLNT